MYQIFKYSSIFSIIIIFCLYFYSQKLLKQLDSQIYYWTQSLSFLYPTKSPTLRSSNVVIINVDQKSINEIQHWPWSRVIYAQLIHCINKMNPSTIGLNMQFFNRDKASPIVMEQFYKRYFHLQTILDGIPKELQNNDKLLAQNIANTRTVLSIQMDNQYKLSSPFAQKLSYKIIDIDSIENVSQSYHISCNTKELHLNNNHFGFGTIDTESGGVVRSLPLLKRYENHTIPSFALAILLSLDIHQYDVQQHKLTFLNHTLYLNKNSKILLNFNVPKPKIFSAIDVLEQRVSPKDFHGKIVIVGSDIDSKMRYKTYNGISLSSSIIHATVIENLLNGSFFIENPFSKKINIVIAIILSSILYLFIKKDRYFLFMITPIVIFFISLGWLIYAFNRGEYIAIGYLWIPLIVVYILLSLMRNFKEKKKLKNDLSKSYTTTANTMTLVAKIHDQETGEHLIRTKKYVQLLANRLYEKKLYTDRLTPHYIELIYEAAPLHDIGKVGIPDAVLKKPGKFTVDEYEIMKTHSKLGADIIKESLEYYEHNPLLEVGYNIALYHHEKWDGSGYPHGLKGDKIPIEAQLMSIADVYDALISKRRYKDSFTYEKAESIILSERGKSFNPILVDIFIKEKESFKTISLEWHEEKMV